MTSSYTGSICMLLFALFDCTKAALIFALFLNKIMHITVTVMETNTETVKAVVRALMDTIQTELCSAGVSMIVLLGSERKKMPLIGSLLLLMIVPQTAVCTASVHMLSVGTSVQVTVVSLVVVGQLPQFDARIL